MIQVNKPMKKGDGKDNISHLLLTYIGSSLLIPGAAVFRHADVPNDNGKRKKDDAHHWR